VEYPLDAVYHKVYLYFNERVAAPYGSLYVIDHITWDDLITASVAPIGITQEDDLHGYFGLDGRLLPHPRHYPQSFANPNYYTKRIATANNA